MCKLTHIKEVRPIINYCNRLRYFVRVQSMDHVVAVKMRIIAAIPKRFNVKNRQFVQLCYTGLLCLRGSGTSGLLHD